MALTELLATKEKETPEFTATVTLGGKPLMTTLFHGRSLDIKRASTLMADLRGANQAPLVFSKEGTGVLYYDALLRYAPQEMPVTALDRGIIVQRWFEPWAGGGQTRAVAAGELVRIKIRVASPSERRFVVIEAPLPAGLEAVDPTLATSARPPSPAPEEGETAEGEETGEETEPMSPWAESFWSPFNHKELRDDRVLLFADQLPAGVFETSIVARATTAGEFVLPPARAEMMYAPEVSGRSDGGRFSILLAAPEATKK